MRKADIKVGGLYLAKVTGRVVTVRVDAIHETEGRSYRTSVGTPRDIRSVTIYEVTNLATGRKTTFRSAAKFRLAVGDSLPTARRKLTGGGAMTAPQIKEYQGMTPAQIMADLAKSKEDEQRPDPTVRSATAQVDGSTTATSETTESSDASAIDSDCSDPTDTADDMTDSAGDTTTLPRSLQGDAVALPVDQLDADTLLHPERVADRLLQEERSTRPFTSAPSAAGTRGGMISAPTTARASSFASRIASTLPSGHVSGRTIAGMVPNEEQELIISTAGETGLKVLVIAAGAGTGKTATLKMLEQVLVGRGQYTAFNTALVAESKAKFVKAACNTTHSLAFRAVGRRYQHRLNADRMKSWQVAQILGISDMHIELEGQTDEEGAPKTKRLRADHLAGQVLVAIKRFCYSADPEITDRHFGYIDGIDFPVQTIGEDGETITKRTNSNNKRVKDYLLPFALKAWEDLTSLEGSLPFSHDIYVKLWQLGKGNDRPFITADYILLDEAQDTAPVFLDIIKQQSHALLVMVGDDNQQIYEWRGAVNAMGAFSGAPRRLLSQSYRFGQSIADVANTVLTELDDPTDLVMRGNPDIPSRVGDVTNPRCYLYRTNAGAIGRVMSAIQDGNRPHLIGGGAETVSWCQAAMDLQAKRGTRHPDLCCFDSWSEVQEYSKTDEGGDLRLMVRLIDEFGAQKIRDAIKDMPPEESADMVVSTAHKSKGREWDTVKLGHDFPTVNKMGDPDRRLLYVALTRAKIILDISECPPFCGGYDKTGGAGGEGEWIPGMDITYTEDMPTKEEQAEWMASREGEHRSNPTVRAGVSPAPSATAMVAPATVANTNLFTWINVDGGWRVRGPAGVEIGSKVNVTRKNGSTSQVVIKSVVRRFADAWAYAV